MKILMCSSEVAGFAKTGGLADVLGALPVALKNLGHEVKIIMPRYKSINAKTSRSNSKEIDFETAKIANAIEVYLINNDKYFARDGLYGTKLGDYPDNLERFSFYCRQSLELLKEIGFKPDIVHCHDWQTALIPVYLKFVYKDAFYKGIKSLFTIHNLAYQGLFLMEQYSKLGLDWALFNVDGFEFYGKINFLKAGIIFSDLINTVSSRYAAEIQTKEFGCGLEGVLGRRKNDLFGIINGLDYSYWDPQKDKYIYRQYVFESIGGKYTNKEKLQGQTGLSHKDQPLFGFVGRLSSQKGMDLIAASITELLKKNHIQLVALGTGDLKYHNLLEGLVKKYPKNVAAYLKFDEELAHKIYAASDIFLMPSHYEPCGLGQMIALKYGSIPLVFKTGGLADTINQENGFVFDSYTKESFIKTTEAAIKAYKDKQNWQKLIRKAMSCNFSWDESAGKYVELYERLTKVTNNQ